MPEREENIRKLLGKEPVNIFEDVEDDPTYGTGITQHGARSRPRPGWGRVKTSERGENVQPLRRADRTTGIRKRSSPSDT